jgi:hypothetical protein
MGEMVSKKLVAVMDFFPVEATDGFGVAAFV